MENVIQNLLIDVCAVDSKPTKKAPVKNSELHRVNLLALLKHQEGKFVAVDFIKQDGNSRKLNGRLGVVKHLKGGTNTVEAEDRPYLVVYDLKTEGYRTVNLATVSEVRAQNTKYAVIG